MQIRHSKNLVPLALVGKKKTTRHRSGSGTETEVLITADKTADKHSYILPPGPTQRHNDFVGGSRFRRMVSDPDKRSRLSTRQQQRRACLGVLDDLREERVSMGLTPYRPRHQSIDVEVDAGPGSRAAEVSLL